MSVLRDALTSGLQRADTKNTRAVLQDIDAYSFMLEIASLLGNFNAINY